MRACAVGLAGGPPRKRLHEGLNFFKKLMRSLTKKKKNSNALFVLANNASFIIPRNTTTIVAKILNYFLSKASRKHHWNLNKSINGLRKCKKPSQNP
jgi:uncharacterized membrane protein